MRRVIKLGGSLLDWPEWPARFRRWIERQALAENWVLVGGGQSVEALRDYDRRWNLPPTVSHAAALRAMDLNLELAAAWVPATCVDASDIFGKGTIARDQVVELAETAAHTMTLPDQGTATSSPTFQWVKSAKWALAQADLLASWSTTSDSIAMALGRAWNADEVVLLKSSLGETSGNAGDVTFDSHSVDSWAARNLVDPEFPRHVFPGVEIRLVNLRADTFPELRGSRRTV